MAEPLTPAGRLRILVLCPFPLGTGAGQRLKFEQYYPDWEEHGAELVIAPFMDMRLWRILYEPGHLPAKALGVLRGYLRRVRDLLRVRRFDLVYVHQWVTPLGPPLFEGLVRRLAKALVFDLEDNVLAGQKNTAKNPNPLARMLRGHGKARFLVEQADHVITSSPALAESSRQRNHRGRATYITSSVDTDRFVPVNRFRGSEGLTIGWTGTSGSRPMLELLGPMFQRLAKRRSFRLRVIGNFDYALPGVDLEVLRWSAQEEVTQMQGIDIGVYPLPLDDDEWVGGKSGLKAIQYMAFGLPIVATAAGHTPAIIRDGENGLLVREEDEWIAALERLIGDPDLRRRLGEQARRDAVAGYSLQAVADRYRDVLRDALKG